MQGLAFRVLGHTARHSRAVALRQGSIPVGSRRQYPKQLRFKSTPASPLGAPTAPKTSASTTPAAPAATPKTAEQAAVASEKATAAGAAPAKEAAASPQIPDVHSTSLGIEDPDANDPLKWRKFVWKYAGAVAVFLVAYKAVNWYVDKLEADGKRQREEMEENKILKKEFEADREKAQAMLAMAQGLQAPGAAPGVAPAGMPQQQMQQPVSLFKTVQEEEGFVSELDELRTLQVELEAKLKALKKERRQTDEIMSKRWEIEGELKDLEREMVDLEKMEARRQSG